MNTMSKLTIVTLCQALANLTHNRCHLLANSNTCLCSDNESQLLSSTMALSSTSQIMFSEVLLIFFVLAIWLSAIGFCLNQYKSLRRLETQVHYCVSRKDPLNIGEIKIVAREQDSIIYKKKRYSTLLDTHIHPDELKAMHYVQQYLPKTPLKAIPSLPLTPLVLSRDDLTANRPLTTIDSSTSANNIALFTRHERMELQSFIPYFQTETRLKKHNGKLAYIQRAGSARYSTGLTVPDTSIPSSLHSSMNRSYLYETSCSTQHLCVPSNSLRLNRYSDGEELLDPRLISETVRRSLLALHRESHENLTLFKKREKTQSENDVHGAFTPWKIKMKSKLKRTHHQQQQQQQQQLHSNTLSVSSIKPNTYELASSTRSTSPLGRRSLKHFPKYSTQSTSESETAQGDISIQVPTDDNDDERANSKFPKPL